MAEGSAWRNESASDQGDAWEREVRDVLADRVAGVRPSGDDLAGVAIASGRRQRRFRNLAAMMAVLVATVIATGALLFDWRGSTGTEYGPVTGLLGDPVTASPIPSDEPARLAYDRQLAADLSADVIGDGATGGVVLSTEDGETIDLGPVREVVSARRVGDGWAVISGGGASRLWWVTVEGEPKSLLAGMDAIVVGQDQVAWRRGSVMFAASLSGDGELQGRVSTAAPDGGGPVGFAGEAVLLKRADPRAWDTWHPASGEYRPEWTGEVVRVYRTPAGPEAIGLVDSTAGESCLARLDPERSLAVAERSCVTESLSASGPASVSPQGRWLMATDRRDQNGVLVDLAAAFEQDPASVTEVTEVAAPATEPVWLDPNVVLFLTADQVVKVWPERLHAGAEDAIEAVDRSGAGLLMVEPV